MCKACDQVLLAPDAAKETVAISWLHVIREHPVFLTKYDELFESAGSVKDIIIQWKKSALNKAVWVRQCVRSLVSYKADYYSSTPIKKKALDLIFVSHLVNPTHAGKPDDFYFGALPHQLAQHGYNVAVVLINHTNASASVLADKWNPEGPVPRIVLASTLSISHERAINKRMRTEALRLKANIARETDPFLKKIFRKTSTEARTGNTRLAMRIGAQIDNIVTTYAARALVTTHEGHAWERIVFATAREANPDIICIGYQHAALFRLQHAIRRNLVAKYNPAHILTAGVAGMEQLVRTGKLDNVSIAVLGSNRVSAGEDNATLREGRQDTCIVLPEGILSECLLLFRYSLKCAFENPSIQFIWRLHPIIRFADLQRIAPEFKNLPSNITMSYGQIDEEFRKCRWALYRGTTLIIQAVLAGLRPVYLEIPGEMTIDPLYQISGSIKRVADIFDFTQLVTDNNTTEKNAASEEDMQELLHYCKDFFRNFKPSVLIDCIKE